MDTHTPTDTAVTASTHHAFLWVGPDETLATKAHEYIQKQLCPHDGCDNCTSCKQIAQRQHHALLWLEPEKNYTLDMIDQLCNTMAYALTPGTSFFFVLQRADTLSIACSNRLLKALEEPPIGYRFILLAQRTDTLLPTIRSRCVMQTWYAPANTNAHQQIIEYFTNKKAAPATEFLAFIDSAPLNEYQSSIIMDTILTHWIRMYQKARLKNDAGALMHIQQVIVQLYLHIEKPPMPGSTKLFWKNLFLQIHG
jgi:DNA polymerase III subunit delta'